jgi:hypothetical protein
MKPKDVGEFLGMRAISESIAIDICYEHSDLLWFGQPLKPDILKIVSILMQEMIE